MLNWFGIYEGEPFALRPGYSMSKSQSWLGLKQNLNDFMLGMAFIVKSLLNKTGSNKTDTDVLFIISYYWKLDFMKKKKRFLFLLLREAVSLSNLEYKLSV